MFVAMIRDLSGEVDGHFYSISFKRGLFLRATRTLNTQVNVKFEDREKAQRTASSMVSNCVKSSRESDVATESGNF